MLTDDLKKITPQERDDILKDVLIFGIPWQDGLPGKDGADGKQGNRWEKWDKSDKWETWLKWEKWDKGDIWNKWDKGDIWEQGIQWLKGDKWDTWKDWKDGVDGLDSITIIGFSRDGKERLDTMIEWTRYIRFVNNGHIMIIDFYKFIK